MIDGALVNLTAANNYEHKLEGEKVNVTVYKYRAGMGQSVHMTTDLYDLIVYVTPRQWDEEVQEVARSADFH